MYFGKQNILNCASRSPELPAATRLQWLQRNPFGKLRLSKLRPLKVFDFAADMLRLLFYMSDYIVQAISTETEVVEVLRSIIFFVSRNTSLDQGECSLFLPRLDGRNQQNIQPWLNKIHSCWHFLLVFSDSSLQLWLTFPQSSSWNNSPLARLQIKNSPWATLSGYKNDFAHEQKAPSL